MKPGPAIPADLPLAWFPRAATMRLLQLYWRTYDGAHEGSRDTRKPRRRHWRWGAKFPKPVMGWAEEAGVVWIPMPLGRSSGRVRCPRCEALRRQLLEHDAGGWGCSYCAPMPRVDQEMARYACALRFGLAGGMVRPYRMRLLERGRKLARCAKTPDDMLILAQIAALAGPKTFTEAYAPKRVLPRCYDEGPMRRAVKAVLMPAAVDALLHHDAYLARYGARGAT